MTNVETASFHASSSSATRRKTLWIVQENAASRTAFALVLAGYGDAFAAIALGRGMGPEHTLIALQPPEDESPSTPTELAARYVDALQAIRPYGPYCLGGYSAGALLALEMARQLRNAGHEVSLLVMLDPLFAQYGRLERLSWFLFEQFVRVLTPMLGRNRHFKILIAMIQDRGLQQHIRVLQNYMPEPYAGRITLVEANGSRFLRSPLFVSQWKRVALGGLDRPRPGGTHHSFMRPPHVGKLGAQIGEWMTALTAHRRA